jgi:hypothetical protein
MVIMRPLLKWRAGMLRNLHTFTKLVIKICYSGAISGWKEDVNKV